MGRGFTFTAGLWAVPLLPDVIREAVFSGTVLADLVDESGTQSDVKINSLQMLVLIVQHNDHCCEIGGSTQ